MANKILIKNSLIGIIQYSSTALLTLISVPIFIHKLGIQQYGIFAIISIVGNLNMLTSFGLNGALLINISKQGKCKESDQEIVATLIMMLCILLIVCVFTICFSTFIISHIFNIPPIYADSSKNLFILLVIANAFLLIGQTYTSIVDALQKNYITNIYQLIYSLIYWGGMIFLLSNGFGLSEVGIIALTAAIIWFIGISATTHKIWGRFNMLNFKDNYKLLIKKQFLYGSKIYLSGILGFLLEPLSKILISKFIGLEIVGFFEIGNKVRGQINGIIQKAIYPIYPLIAAVENNNNMLFDKIHKFTKTIQLLSAPFSLIIIFTFPYIIELWLGKPDNTEYVLFTTVMTVILLLFFIPIQPIYYYLRAKKMESKNILIHLITVILNIMFFFIFLKYYKTNTILISISLSYVISGLLYNYYQLKYFNKSVNKQIIFISKNILFLIVGYILCKTISFFIPVDISNLFVYPIIIILLFIIFVYLINDEEIMSVKRHITKFIKIKRTT